jgi:hypothetical protein
MALTPHEQLEVMRREDEELDQLYGLPPAPRFPWPELEDDLLDLPPRPPASWYDRYHEIDDYDYYRHAYPYEREISFGPLPKKTRMTEAEILKKRERDRKRMTLYIQKKNEESAAGNKEPQLKQVGGLLA